jgi:glycosyltransferase involved in cell wall biosynthesis
VWPRKRTQVDPRQPRPRPTGAWQSLLEEGLLDVEYYSAQAGRPFDSAEEAARHLQSTGMALGLSPHPLIDISLLPRPIRRGWHGGQLRRALEHLKSDEGLERAWSPLFAPLRITDGQRVPTWSEVTGWIRALRPDQQLLAAAPALQQVTWHSARSALIAHAERVAADRRLNEPRTTNAWDAAAESAWLAGLQRTGLPDDALPVVSVIMPVWNRAGRVREAVASVQAQDLEAWELIAVDDGSTDDTVDVLRELAASDPRIVVVEAPHGGVSRARNVGLGRAGGRYVAFLDSDNTWRPVYLSTMVRAMTRDRLSAAYAGVSMRSSDGLQYRAYAGDREHLLVHNHIDLNVLMLSAELARKVGGFDAGLRRWVDHDYVLRVAEVEVPQLLPFLGCDYDDRDDHPDPDRITLREPDNWAFAVLGKAWLDWAEVAEQVDGRVAGRTTVVIVAQHQIRRAIDAARSVVLSVDDDEDVEVVVMDDGLPPALALGLRAALLEIPRVRIERLPRRLQRATAHNLGVARGTGETVLFLAHDCVLRPGWLQPLRERLADPAVVGAQALVLAADDTVDTAGHLFPVAGALPATVASGHPREDAAALRSCALPAASGSALLMRARDIVELRGFDPRFVDEMDDVDLCLRARDRSAGAFVLEPRAVATRSEPELEVAPPPSPYVTPDRRLFLERWRKRLPVAGRDVLDALRVELVGVGLDGEPCPAPVPVLVRRRPPAAQTPLRWGLQSPVPAGPDGDRAELTSTCAALADGLRGLGQEAVVHRLEAHHGTAGRYDDVALAVRVNDRVDPDPGRVNVLWVLGEGTVPSGEVAGFDLVAVPSRERAEALAGTLDVPVLLLPRIPSESDLVALIDAVGRTRESVR